MPTGSASIRNEGLDMPAAWAGVGLAAAGGIASANASGGGGGGGTEDYYMAQLQAAQDAELARQQNMFNTPTVLAILVLKHA